MTEQPSKEEIQEVRNALKTLNEAGLVESEWNLNKTERKYRVPEDFSVSGKDVENSEVSASKIEEASSKLRNFRLKYGAQGMLFGIKQGKLHLGEVLYDKDRSEFCIVDYDENRDTLLKYQNDEVYCGIEDIKSRVRNGNLDYIEAGQLAFVVNKIYDL